MVVGSLVQRQMQRRGLSSMSDSSHQKSIEHLYDRAERKPDDAEAQAALLRALATEQPHEAIKRFESNQFASNEQCVKAYITALVKANRLGQTNLGRIFPDYQSPTQTSSAAVNLTRPVTQATPSSSSNFFNAGGNGLGSEESPIYVTMQEPSARTQMWRIIRTMLILLLVFSAMNQLMDDRGLGPKGQQAHQVFFFFLMMGEGGGGGGGERKKEKFLCFR